MGAIGGMLGLSGGAGGSGFAAPTAATLDNATNSGQVQQAQAGANSALNQNQQLLNALQGQNGLGNQSQVYNQLQGVANGTGPNPAQAMLNQATNANNQTTSAQIASQRGVNAGLAARLGAQQGAANQQNAAAQGATMQANQSLNAIGQAGQMANTQAANQVGQTNANTSAQLANTGQQYNALQGQNANVVSQQNNINSANAGLANTQMQGGQAMLGGVMSGFGATSSLAKGGVVNMADGGFPTLGGSSPMASQGGGGGGAGGLLKLAFLADGGSIQGPQSSFGQFLNGVTGGEIGQGSQASFGADSAADSLESGAASGVGMAKKAASGSSTPYTDANYTMPAIGDQFQGQAPTLGDLGNLDGSPSKAAASGGPSLGNLGSLMAKGGKVPAMVSPGEAYISPDKMHAVKKGANPLKVAERIPGKAKVKGDSLKNDVVPKTLETGGMVLPRSVMTAKHPAWEAHKFISAHLGLSKGKKAK